MCDESLVCDFDPECSAELCSHFQYCVFMSQQYESCSLRKEKGMRRLSVIADNFHELPSLWYSSCQHPSSPLWLNHEERQRKRIIASVTISRNAVQLWLRKYSFNKLYLQPIKFPLIKKSFEMENIYSLFNEGIKWKLCFHTKRLERCRCCRPDSRRMIESDVLYYLVQI